ncbi:MAG: hypothetical protein ACP5KN_19030 [Armatimonadota bacterium]
MKGSPRCSAVALLLALSLTTLGAQEGEGLVELPVIYLSVHGFSWVEMTPDDPRREEPRWEQWPGRCDLVHPLGFEYRLRIYQTIRNAPPDSGLLVIPTGSPANNAMIEYARRYFGDRIAVCEFGYNREEFLQELGEEFRSQLERDRTAAEAMRVEGVSDAAFDNEFLAWERSRAWAVDLKRTLEANGYTFDPENVRMVCWGGDWRGCAATYPIQMARAWGLAQPVERRWDLIIHDTGPLDITADLVVANVKLPENIRLFVFRSKEGLYCAEYWDGIHSPLDRPKAVELTFPTASVRVVDVHVRARTDLLDRITANAGTGGHTPHRPDILQADPSLPLDDFYSALTSGTVVVRE